MSRTMSSWVVFMATCTTYINVCQGFFTVWQRLPDSDPGSDAKFIDRCGLNTRRNWGHTDNTWGMQASSQRIRRLFSRPGADPGQR